MNAIKTLIGTVVVFAGLALVPAAKAQIVVEIGVQPVCSYGYYDYAPYECAPMGFYGSGYFYNGIFLGMGPWAGWGYGHGGAVIALKVMVADAITAAADIK